MNELNQQFPSAQMVGIDSSKPVGFQSPANDSPLCTDPQPPTSVWDEVTFELDSPTETISLDIGAEDEDSLKLKVLLRWEKCDKYESSVGEVLYALHKKLHAPGKKDEGFNAWLKSNGKPRATAYRWIKKYAEPLGLELPHVAKTKPKATSSHVGQGASSPTSGMLNRNPVPDDLASVKVLLYRFFEVAPPQIRSEWAVEFVDWIKSEFLTSEGSPMEELS